MAIDLRTYMAHVQQATGLSQTEIGQEARRLAAYGAALRGPGGPLVPPAQPRRASCIRATRSWRGRSPPVWDTLESLGLAPPLAAQAAPPAPPLPPPPPLPDAVVDSVVCAAAEAMQMMPRDVRPGLLAAFAKAREIGLPVDRVERVLRETVQGAKLAPGR